MGLSHSIRKWASDLLSMIYPECCEVCGTRLVGDEKVICTGCYLEMPRCNIHDNFFNTLHQRLAGHVVIERAAGYFYYYRGNPYTRLIHVAKYNGRPETGRELAARFADEIMNDGFFDGMDLIVPVPLHRFKKLKRGYNQTEYIAEGIARKTGLAINRNLIALKPHSSQTRKNAFERWKNSLDIYGVKNPEELENKHILLVDDVITTGSTMLACCEAIHRAAPSATISVIALGVTNLT